MAALCCDHANCRRRKALATGQRNPALFCITDPQYHAIARESLGIEMICCDNEKCAYRVRLLQQGFAQVAAELSSVAP